MRRRQVGEVLSRAAGGPVLGKVTDREARLMAQAAERARVDERRRIGQALHDGTGQLLSVALLHLRLLAGSVAAPADQVRVEELRQLVKASLDELRQTSHRLCPPTLERQGLAHALAELAATSTTPELQVTLRSSPHLPGSVSPQVSLELFRIAQTAVANVVQHAAARRCTVSLQVRDGGARLEVEDDGRGFEPASAAGGIGLTGMRERACAVGATLAIDSRPGRGTRVAVEAPLRAP